MLALSKWKIYTPEGVQDILFDECFAKRNIESRIRDVFRKSGYFEVETPTLEFYDTFSVENDLLPQETMFKFIDQQGRILVLRPETTIPVARIAATKFKDMQLPVKVSYIGNAFKYNELGGGKQKEFTQAGIEVLGVNTPESDAEVIAAAIDAVRATGLENFQIDIGQVEFFKGLMEETGLSKSDIEQMRILIDRKDFLGIEELVKGHDIRNELKELIFNLPRYFGSLDVIENVKKVQLSGRSLEALSNLKQVLEILDDYGYSKYVSVDLGMVQSLNYYTGIIFRGFTYGIGFPILSGGRYDNLIEKFGKKCTATGFSLGVNMIMMALDRQKIDMGKPVMDSIICYGGDGRKTALSLVRELRKQGLAVEVDISGDDTGNIRAYAENKGIGGIIRILDKDRIEIINIKTGDITHTSITELLRK